MKLVDARTQLSAVSGERKNGGKKRDVNDGTFSQKRPESGKSRNEVSRIYTSTSLFFFLAELHLFSESSL